MAHSTPPTPRRGSRLQFSLRLLLLAFTAFAIGFPIWYRWPFEETEHKYPSGTDPFAPAGARADATPYATITKTWRRTWGGGKVQHGRAVMDYRQPWPRKTIEHYSNGERHGNFEQYLNGKLMSSGQYVDGRREGAWIGYDAKGNVTCTAHWRHDRLDGPYQIALDGGRKQQFQFAQGKLLDVNGRPIQNRLVEQLAAGDIDEPRIANELQALMPIGIEFVETPLKDALQYLQDQYNIPIVLDVRRVRDIDLPLTLNVRGADLCSGLTLLTAQHDLAFEYRYGVLFLTTAEHAQDRRDPTGVADIRPAPGSPLAQAWDEPSQIEAVEMPLDLVLQQLTQRLAIDVDLSGLPVESRTMPATKNLKGLPLRHVLALILDDLNLRAEARGGDTIAILPLESP